MSLAPNAIPVGVESVRVAAYDLDRTTHVGAVNVRRVWGHAVS